MINAWLVVDGKKMGWTDRLSHPRHSLLPACRGGLLFSRYFDRSKHWFQTAIPTQITDSSCEECNILITLNQWPTLKRKKYDFSLFWMHEDRVLAGFQQSLVKFNTKVTDDTARGNKIVLLESILLLLHCEEIISQAPKVTISSLFQYCLHCLTNAAQYQSSY